MSFRTRVLDALDIQKKSVKLQVNERFPKIYSEGEGDELAIDTSSANDMVDYVVSKQIIGPETIHETDPTAVKTVGTGLIGPNVGNGTATYQTLDVLGFVVGQKPSDGGTAAAIGGSTEGNVNEYKNTFVILDQSGGSGKSVLSAICMSTYGMHCQGSGKREDLSYAFSSYFRENPKCKGICLDIPKAATLGSEFRTGAFTFAEQVKSQLVPVTKYESTVLIVPPMHAILFTNTPIPEGAFAEDRVHLITLTKAADVWNWTTKII